MYPFDTPYAELESFRETSPKVDNRFDEFMVLISSPPIVELEEYECIQVEGERELHINETMEMEMEISSPSSAPPQTTMNNLLYSDDLTFFSILSKVMESKNCGEIMKLAEFLGPTPVDAIIDGIEEFSLLLEKSKLKKHETVAAPWTPSPSFHQAAPLSSPSSTPYQTAAAAMSPSSPTLPSPFVHEGKKAGMMSTSYADQNNMKQPLLSSEANQTNNSASASLPLPYTNNNYKEWSEDEIIFMLRSISSNVNWQLIAEALRRTPQEVESQYHKLYFLYAPRTNNNIRNCNRDNNNNSISNKNYYSSSTTYNFVHDERRSVSSVLDLSE